MKFRFIALTALAVAISFTARAHGPNDPPHQSFSLGDFKLESGDVIKDFSISYVTHGTLNADKSNAVLMVTAIGGNHHRIDYLIGPGRALDPSKCFIIATDAIGNGLTTSPSNSKAQPRMQFPKFNIRDMVNSQQRLVSEKFGIKKLVTVIGASMGGMQALQWAVSYPDMMDSIVRSSHLAEPRPGAPVSWRCCVRASWPIRNSMAAITEFGSAGAGYAALGGLAYRRDRAHPGIRRQWFRTILTPSLISRACRMRAGGAWMRSIGSTRAGRMTDIMSAPRPA